MKYEIPQMLDQGKGVIVNTASIMGFIGYPRIRHYVASKHGVIRLTRTVAVEYMNQGIRVNAVCPTYINTPMLTNIIQQQGPKSVAAKLTAIRYQAGFYGQP
jgi:NAD(P)-dependent dehydrogenase (short-subunit alcohol dehydrogenase family)